MTAILMCHPISLTLQVGSVKNSTTQDVEEIPIDFLQENSVIVSAAQIVRNYNFTLYLATLLSYWLEQLIADQISVLT